MNNVPQSSRRRDIRAWLLKNKFLSIRELSNLSGISTKKIAEWCILNDIININDKKLFCKWYHYKRYDIREMAVLLAVSVPTIRRVMRLYGLIKDTPKRKVFIPYPSMFMKPRLPRHLLHNRNSMSYLFGKYGCHTLSKMFGVSAHRVNVVVKKMGFDTTKRIGSPHPNKNRKWLMDNYVNGGLSTWTCAEMAGVSDYAIRDWLAKFGICPRRRSESNLVRHGSVDPRAVTLVTDDPADL